MNILAKIKEVIWPVSKEIKPNKSQKEISKENYQKEKEKNFKKIECRL